jgi:hypothetical protein
LFKQGFDIEIHTKSGILWRAVPKERYASKKEADKRLEELRGSSDRKKLVRAIRSERNEIGSG